MPRPGRNTLSFLVWLVGGALLLTACGGAAAVSTPVEGTGIRVAQVFEAYVAAAGGGRVFGQPITEPFSPGDDGITVQYFRNMRLDYDPTRPAGQEIRPFPLGAWALAGVSAPAPAPTPVDGRLRTFADSGLTVQDAFLAFYESGGVEAVLGPPISPQLDEGGLRVQYFQNGRLEWRPELPVDQRVQVSLLGLSHFKSEMAYVYRQVVARPVLAVDLVEASVVAAVKYPVLYGRDSQMLYVTVLAPDGRPAENVRLQAYITTTRGRQTVDLGRTGVAGQVSVPLAHPGVDPGQQVQIGVTAFGIGGSPLGSTTLSFRTWW